MCGLILIILLILACDNVVFWNSSERAIKELKDKFLHGKCPNLVSFNVVHKF